MTARFADHIAVVTGGSRGIGLAVAHRLVRDGARVVVTARKESDLAAAAAELGGPACAEFVVGRADDPQHQAETVERALALGGLHLLVNNAGINPSFGPIADLTADTARKIFEVNVLVALSWAQRAYHAWQRDHGGAIVNVASVGGLRPPPMIGFYGTSKAALTQLAAQLALEFGPAVRVNAVAPAIVKTDFAAALYLDRETEVAARYPLARLGVPGDVGDAVSFLLSDEASWITGQALTVDGGVLLTGGL